MKKLFVFAVCLMTILLVACQKTELSVQSDSLNATTTLPVITTTSNPTTVTTTGDGNSSNKPPRMLDIRDEETLLLMRKALTDDSALEQYLKECSSPLINNREDVSDFLKLLDNLPNLVIKDAVSFTIQYFPDKGYMDVWFFMDENQRNCERYCFTYVIDERIANSRREDMLLEGTACVEKGNIINGDSNVYVLAKVISTADTEIARKTAVYWLDVYGWVVSVTYTSSQEIDDTITASAILASAYMQESF